MRKMKSHENFALLTEQFISSSIVNLSSGNTSQKKKKDNAIERVNYVCTPKFDTRRLISWRTKLMEEFHIDGLDSEPQTSDLSTE